MSSRWGIYLKERFPLIPNLIAALGMAFSSARLALTDGVKIPLGTLAFAVFGGIVFLAQIRFMDELKDVEKDKIAHPERPLPRGLFTPQEFGNWILRFHVLMIGIAALLSIFVNQVSALCFFIGTGYLYLMYREFFIGKWLSDRPLLYAISHQVITFPMVAFAFSVFEPHSIHTRAFISYSSLLVCVFFAFEIGRKLDPNSHPILKTYLRVYGKKQTALFMGVLLALYEFCAIQLGLFNPLGISALFCFFLLSILWVSPNQFKWIEGVLLLLLLASLWVIPIKGWL